VCNNYVRIMYVKGIERMIYLNLTGCIKSHVAFDVAKKKKHAIAIAEGAIGRWRMGAG
jgi:hypothetical protein